ncbi:MAG: hypothetical protein LH609_21980, partial [Rudanella sp.]|nr:hypothetical protein [Rudanella sp.]
KKQQKPKHMKTFIKSLAVALTVGVVSLSTSVAATPGVSAPKIRPVAHSAYQSAVYPSQFEPVINVIVQKEEGSTVQIRFKTNQGETLAERSVGRGKEKVAMKFRLSELPDGVYRIEITNGRDVTSKTIKLSTQQENPRTIAMQ